MPDPDPAPVVQARAALRDADAGIWQLHRDLGPLHDHMRAARRTCHRLGLTEVWEQLQTARQHMTALHPELDAAADLVHEAVCALDTVPGDLPYVTDDDGEPMAWPDPFVEIATRLVDGLAGRLSPHDLELLAGDTAYGIQEPHYFLDELMAALVDRRVPITGAERDVVLALIGRRGHAAHAAGDHPAAMDAFTAALDLWDVPLPDIEARLSAHRQAMRDAHRAVVEQAAARHRDLGHPGHARRLLDEARVLQEDRAPEGDEVPDAVDLAHARLHDGVLCIDLADTPVARPRKGRVDRHADGNGWA